MQSFMVWNIGERVFAVNFCNACKSCSLDLSRVLATCLGDVGIMGRQIVLLGGNALNAGFERLREKLDIEKIIVIDWNERPAYLGDQHFQLDIKDTAAIAKLPLDWAQIAFVYTSADVGVRTQVRLHRKLGLVAPTDESVENAIFKNRMRDCWERCHILNKYSEVISDAEEFKDLGCKKYIFKPNASSGSRNITILARDELAPDTVQYAVEFAKRASSDHRCIVEEFIEGHEYTVDMLGDAYGNVGVYGISKKYHTRYNPQNKIATKLHYAPGDVSREELERIGEFGQQCYRALGLTASFGHLEVIVSDSGKIVPVEIGARSSGYIATMLIDIITSKSYLGDYLHVLQGGRVTPGLNFAGDMSAMYYFYDIHPGVCREVRPLLDFLPNKVQSYAFDRSKIEVGRKYGVIQADHERYGFEILGGPKNYLNIENVTKAEKQWNRACIEGCVCE